jgi:hypothetical protein
LLGLVFAVGCTSQGTPITEVASPSATLLPSPSPTKTELPPTATRTQLPPTSTGTPTATSTHTVTPTSQPPELIIVENVACRTGPGLVYDIRAYLSQNTTPVLIAGSEDQAWWFVEEPQFEANCWVSTDFASLQGDLDLLPVFTPEPTPTQVPSPTSEEKGMKVFMVNLNTGGPFGCGDGLVYFYTGKQRTGDVERDISAAMNALFKLKTSSGKVFIYLGGSIPKPPDECEAQRIHDQVWETARQISGYRSITIRVNNKLLGDLIAVGDR